MVRGHHGSDARPAEMLENTSKCLSGVTISCQNNQPHHTCHHYTYTCPNFHHVPPPPPTHLHLHHIHTQHTCKHKTQTQTIGQNRRKTESEEEEKREEEEEEK
ncbi:hypothetical protein Scep_011969 [Stephania cephalantha]|uniref:Uncharacterized protein n=1 Tax=Stephania cephalantha TaxID=152367 RepID=A0AAP0JE40_9MAGN